MHDSNLHDGKICGRFQEPATRERSEGAKMDNEIYVDGLGIAAGVVDTIVLLAAKEVDGGKPDYMSVERAISPTVLANLLDQSIVLGGDNPNGSWPQVSCSNPLCKEGAVGASPHRPLPWPLSSREEGPWDGLWRILPSLYRNLQLCGARPRNVVVRRYPCHRSSRSVRAG